jgi:hypothetical protein
MPVDDPIAVRLDRIERQLAGLAGRFSEPHCSDKREGRAILSVRVGDELAALVRLAARQRGCTIADLLRPAIATAVNLPSTHQLSEIHSHKLPRDEARRAMGDYQ